MTSFIIMTKRLLRYSVVSVYIFAILTPLSHPIYAQESGGGAPPVTESTEAEPTPEAPKPKEPVFVYNRETGLWESKFYTWDPVTRQTAPKYPIRNKPDVQTPSDSTPVQPETTPANPTESQNDTSQTTQTDTDKPKPTATKTHISDSTYQPLNSTASGNGSDKKIGTKYNPLTTKIDLSNNTTLNTSVDSTATSGDASILQNTTAGDATSGDASAMANVINMLQSTWGWSGLTPQIHTIDIQGDYTGDIIINPANLSSNQNNNCTLCGSDNTINVDNDATINNNISLIAESGDAIVSGNTTAGDAASGNATAIANVVNMISSSIASGQSFLGVINVHGSLTGDVLIEDDLVDQLIAANVPTTEVSMCDTCGNILADITDNQTINNNLNLSASSGDANVTANTQAGNATSGNASTKATVFNLTGKNVVGQDALLVFVNVQGEWVGFITNAPEGSTAAALGSNLTENNGLPSGEYDINNTATINNNINVNASTGDATVSYNTQAGDATSGDAHASVNLANITNSSFGLTGWFGILFINVLGDWHGSFGTDTAFGNKPTNEGFGSSPATSTNNMRVLGQANQPQPSNNTDNQVRVFRVSFEDDSTQGVSLASAQEITPPSSTTNAERLVEPELLTEESDRVFTTLAWVLIVTAAFGAIMHGDSLRSLIFRGRSS